MATSAAALVLASCGGADSKADSAAQAPGTVNAAAATPAAAVERVAETARNARGTSFTFTESGAGSNGSGRGSYSTKPQLALQIVFDSAKVAGRPEAAALAGAEMRIISDTFYLKLAGAPGKALGGKWLKASAAEADSVSSIDVKGFLTQATATDPGSQIQTLLAAANITEVGKETIDGVATTHYSGDVSPEQLANSSKVDARIREAMEGMYAAGGVYGTKLDLWVDEQQRPRKLVVNSATTQGGRTSTTTFSDYGQEVKIGAPSARKVLNLTDLKVGAGQSGG